MTDTLSPALPAGLDRRINEGMGRICARGYRLVTAESCTGGLIASVLTDVPGCAHVFERGFVVYSPEAKREILGISQLLLDGPGPVSEPVARAMAEGALARSIAGMAIAVTGFAGPGGPGDGGSRDRQRAEEASENPDAAAVFQRMIGHPRLMASMRQIDGTEFLYQGSQAHHRMPLDNPVWHCDHLPPHHLHNPVKVNFYLDQTFPNDGALE